MKHLYTLAYNQRLAWGLSGGFLDVTVAESEITQILTIKDLILGQNPGGLTCGCHSSVFVKDYVFFHASNLNTRHLDKIDRILELF